MPSCSAGSAMSRPLIAITQDGGEGRVRLTKSGRVRIDYRARRHAASRRSVTRSSRWPSWPARPGPARSSPSARRRAGTAAPGFLPGEEERAFVVYRDALAAFDFAPEPRQGLLGPPDGHASGWAPTADHPAIPRGRVRTASGNGDPGPLRRRRIAVPDGDRGQPDDHDHGPRPAGRSDGRVGRLIVPGRVDRAVVLGPTRRLARRPSRRIGSPAPGSGGPRSSSSGSGRG